MSRRSRQSHLWNLDTRDPAAAANARIVLALLRCVQRLPGAFASHNFDDLGETLAPAFVACVPRLRQALVAHAQGHRAGEDDDDLPTAADPGLLHHRSVHLVLGEALARSLPRFRPLFCSIERKLADFVDAHPCAADRNVDQLAGLLALPPAEVAFIRLAAAFCYGTVERSLFNFVDSQAKVMQALEVICGARGGSALRLFSRHGALARSYLLEALNRNRNNIDLEDLLALSAAGECLLGTPHDDVASMARALLKPMPQTAEATAAMHWPHLEAQLGPLQCALASAVRNGTPGINVLLYGAPGTGKTEFARQLVHAIGAQGYLVEDRSEHGGEASREDRLGHLQLGQTFAGQQGAAVMVLDEAEDVFDGDYNHPLAGLLRPTGHSKAWMNTLLEHNPHPVIWISNRIAQMDPAYLRRFTFCLEFPQTPLPLRRTIAAERLGAVGCSTAFIERIADVPELTPAHLDTAARFVALCRDGGLAADAVAGTQIEAQLRAVGHPGRATLARPETRFDLRYINVAGSADAARIVAALDRGRGRGGRTLLFSGPPGTGKTQFAADIAERLQLKLLVRTASDIRSKWYGESEARVAALFKNCDPRTEMLFLDEAESLLAERGHGGHRADLAVTAEFLRWLEPFEGVFVCATNHAGGLDAALTRRFTYRLAFQPLNPVQRIELYAELAAGWQPGQPAPQLEPEVATRLALLGQLTPGDFANAARRMRSLELPAGAWIGELEAEHAAKPSARGSRIGFL